MRSQIGAQVTMLSTRNSEKETLYAEIETLKQEILDLDQDLHIKSKEAEANLSRKNNFDGDKSNEELESVWFSTYI